MDRGEGVMVPKASDRCMRGHEPVIREDGAIEIPLTQRQRALVDTESYPAVRDHKWVVAWSPNTRSYRAAVHELCNGKRRTLYMHREVTGARPGTQVDHRNHNTLDNRLGKLRVVTNSENCANRRHMASSSRFKGVSKCSTCERWQAQIKHSGKVEYLGLFRSEEEAARAYDAAALERFGEYAFTNADAGLLV